MTGIRLRHLIFTGFNIEPAILEFDDGLNIIYGASNTGKSFTSKAILFMLGVSKSLPETEEIVAYDSVWLGITMPDGSDITLYRSTRGGHFKLFEGLVREANLDEGVELRQQHDSKRTDSVSQLLLEAMDLSNKRIVRDGNGAKDSLSIYLLSPYAVVSEEDIIAEKSPVYASGIPQERTLEQNLFKLLLTGVDDSAAVTVPKLSERKVAKAAKIELVDELIAQIDAELGEELPEEKELEKQLDRLDRSTSSLFVQLQNVQSTLDELAIKRRKESNHRDELKKQESELDLTLHRFDKLQAVYNSDLQRLQSIEEGGYVLVAMAGMACPVCGAPPDAQTHNHAAEEISMAHRAAAAEAHKIEREQFELVQTITSLKTDAGDLRRAIEKASTAIEDTDKKIQEIQPHEASLRKGYEIRTAKRAEITKTLDLYQRRAKLATRRALIDAEPTKREREAPPAGPDSTTLYKFGEIVKSVLDAWQFPNADKVEFDGKTNDITVAGKRRSANGKGVRALLHAAFNVAVIVYCIKNKLPHPGFLVLDTPLLTYREPMTSRHGDLAEDEAVLKETNLAQHFYRHLASLKNEVQLIVIENSDPPAAIYNMARIETFTGLEGNGRFGLLEREN